MSEADTQLVNDSIASSLPPPTPLNNNSNSNAKRRRASNSLPHGSPAATIHWRVAEDENEAAFLLHLGSFLQQLRDTIHPASIAKKFASLKEEVDQLYDLVTLLRERPHSHRNLVSGAPTTASQSSSSSSSAPSLQRSYEKEHEQLQSVTRALLRMLSSHLLFLYGGSETVKLRRIGREIAQLLLVRCMSILMHRMPLLCDVVLRRSLQRFFGQKRGVTAATTATTTTTTADTVATRDDEQQQQQPPSDDCVEAMHENEANLEASIASLLAAATPPPARRPREGAAAKQTENNNEEGEQEVGTTTTPSSSSVTPTTTVSDVLLQDALLAEDAIQSCLEVLARATTPMTSTLDDVRVVTRCCTDVLRQAGRLHQALRSRLFDFAASHIDRFTDAAICLSPENNNESDSSHLSPLLLSQLTADYVSQELCPNRSSSSTTTTSTASPLLSSTGIAASSFFERDVLRLCHRIGQLIGPAVGYLVTVVSGVNGYSASTELKDPSLLPAAGSQDAALLKHRVDSKAFLFHFFEVSVAMLRGGQPTGGAAAGGGGAVLPPSPTVVGGTPNSHQNNNGSTAGGGDKRSSTGGESSTDDVTASTTTTGTAESPSSSSSAAMVVAAMLWQSMALHTPLAYEFLAATSRSSGDDSEGKLLAVKLTADMVVALSQAELADSSSSSSSSNALNKLAVGCYLQSFLSCSRRRRQLFGGILNGLSSVHASVLRASLHTLTSFLAPHILPHCAQDIGTLYGNCVLRILDSTYSSFVAKYSVVEHLDALVSTKVSVQRPAARVPLLSESFVATSSSSPSSPTTATVARQPSSSSQQQVGLVAVVDEIPLILSMYSLLDLNTRLHSVHVVQQLTRSLERVVRTAPQMLSGYELVPQDVTRFERLALRTLVKLIDTLSSMVPLQDHVALSDAPLLSARGQKLDDQRQVDVINSHPVKGIAKKFSISKEDLEQKKLTTTTAEADDEGGSQSKPTIVSIEYKDVPPPPTAALAVAAEDIADFLLATPSLNPLSVGEFLSDPKFFPLQVCKVFMRKLHLEGKDVTSALSEMLRVLQLPKEGQRIERLIEFFSHAYFNANAVVADSDDDNSSSSSPPRRVASVVGFPFADVDACFIVLVATVMLNTDLHNPRVSSKMTKESFRAQLRGCNRGADFPEGFADRIFEDIRQKPLSNVKGIGAASVESSTHVSTVVSPPAGTMDFLFFSNSERRELQYGLERQRMVAETRELLSRRGRFDPFEPMNDRRRLLAVAKDMFISLWPSLCVVFGVAMTQSLAENGGVGGAVGGKRSSSLLRDVRTSSSGQSSPSPSSSSQQQQSSSGGVSVESFDDDGFLHVSQTPSGPLDHDTLTTCVRGLESALIFAAAVHLTTETEVTMNTIARVSETSIAPVRDACYRALLHAAATPHNLNFSASCWDQVMALLLQLRVAPHLAASLVRRDMETAFNAIEHIVVQAAKTSYRSLDANTATAGRVLASVMQSAKSIAFGDTAAIGALAYVIRRVSSYMILCNTATTTGQEAGGSAVAVVKRVAVPLLLPTFFAQWSPLLQAQGEHQGSLQLLFELTGELVCDAWGSYRSGSERDDNDEQTTSSSSSASTLPTDAEQLSVCFSSVVDVLLASPSNVIRVHALQWVKSVLCGTILHAGTGAAPPRRLAVQLWRQCLRILIRSLSDAEAVGTEVCSLASVVLRQVTTAALASSKQQAAAAAHMSEASSASAPMPSSSSTPQLEGSSSAPPPLPPAPPHPQLPRPYRDALLHLLIHVAYIGGMCADANTAHACVSLLSTIGAAAAANGTRLERSVESHNNNNNNNSLSPPASGDAHLQQILDATASITTTTNAAGVRADEDVSDTKATTTSESVPLLMSLTPRHPNTTVLIAVMERVCLLLRCEKQSIRTEAVELLRTLWVQHVARPAYHTNEDNDHGDVNNRNNGVPLPHSLAVAFLVHFIDITLEATLGHGDSGHRTPFSDSSVHSFALFGIAAVPLTMRRCSRTVFGATLPIVLQFATTDVLQSSPIPLIPTVVELLLSRCLVPLAVSPRMGTIANRSLAVRSVIQVLQFALNEPATSSSRGMMLTPQYAANVLTFLLAATVVEDNNNNNNTAAGVLTASTSSSLCLGVLSAERSASLAEYLNDVRRAIAALQLAESYEVSGLPRLAVPPSVKRPQPTTTAAGAGASSESLSNPSPSSTALPPSIAAAWQGGGLSLWQLQSNLAAPLPKLLTKLTQSEQQPRPQQQQQEHSSDVILAPSSLLPSPPPSWGLPTIHRSSGSSRNATTDLLRSLLLYSLNHSLAQFDNFATAAIEELTGRGVERRAGTALALLGEDPNQSLHSPAEPLRQPHAAFRGLCHTYFLLATAEDGIGSDEDAKELRSSLYQCMQLTSHLYGVHATAASDKLHGKSVGGFQAAAHLLHVLRTCTAGMVHEVTVATHLTVAHLEQMLTRQPNAVATMRRLQQQQQQQGGDPLRRESNSSSAAAADAVPSPFSVASLQRLWGVVVDDAIFDAVTELLGCTTTTGSGVPHPSHHLVAAVQSYLRMYRVGREWQHLPHYGGILTALPSSSCSPCAGDNGAMASAVVTVPHQDVMVEEGEVEGGRSNDVTDGAFPLRAETAVGVEVEEWKNDGAEIGEEGGGMMGAVSSDTTDDDDIADVSAMTSTPIGEEDESTS